MRKGASVSLDRAVLVLRVGCGLLLVLGMVMLLEGPAKILSHDYEQPSYKHHHHHLCHVLTVALCVTSVWWASLLLLLARSREAMQQGWARRLFGLPVLVLAVVGAVAGYYVWVTIDSHDEVTYAAVLGVACGSVVCVLALVNFSLLIPLREERSYSWNLLALSAAFLGTLFAVLYYNDHHWHWALILTAASLASFVVGLYMSKLVLAAQKIV